MAFDLTEQNEFTAPVRVPEDGVDYREAASLYPAFQALANRSLNLRSRIESYDDEPHTWSAPQHLTAGHISNNLGVQGEILYCDAAGAVQTRSRTVRIPASAFVPDAIGDAPSGEGPAWQYAAIGRNILGAGNFGRGWYAASNEPLVGEFLLPTGARLTSATAVVQLGTFMGASPIGYLEAGISRATLGGTINYGNVASRAETGFVTVNSGPGGAWPSEADSFDMIDVFNAATDVGYVKLTRGVGGVMVVAWVTITFLDPGPRNF